MGKRNRLVRPLTVTADGDGLVSHAGVVLVAETADAVGLTAGMRTALAGLGRRRHDPGVTLMQMALALADGATCVSDLAALRDQQHLFGPVASHPTTWRTFQRLGPVELRGIDAAVAAARARAWAADDSFDPAALFTIDLDATLLSTRSDKQDAAPTYKRGYGFHPLVAMCADRDEILAMMLRPGNAGSNTATDHVIVLGQAIDALPEMTAVGHRNIDGEQPTTPVLVRSDSAGATHWLAEECRDRNCQFSFGYQITGRIRDALLLVQEQAWTRAVDGDGTRRAGAWVIELTDLIDMGDWPDGTRLIVRRERPHPGAQLSLFDTIEGFRHQALITDQPGEPAELECRHRQRARAEQTIRDAKACGLALLPFDDVVNNQIWCQLVTIAVNLLAWTKNLTLTGPMRRATPKTLRYRLFHTAGRITGNARRLHLDRNWPWATTITNALTRLHTLFPPHTVTNSRAAHATL